MKKVALTVLLTACFITLYGQEDAVLDSAVSNITKQLIVFPQEKIYLHTDKPYYITGEKIFFRAFLLDAFSNKPAVESRYVYVELINPTDSVMQRLQIRSDENGLFHGAIPLLEDLPQGIYKIRAYTRYMYNQGESSFFSHYIRIGDPQILEKSHVFKQNIQLPYPEANFDVSFYPEGGNLIAGQSSNVAFKAINTQGEALDITGEVVDSKGNTLTAFKTFHDGMGDFYINPQAEEHYQAVCRYGGRTLRFDLPEVQTNTAAIKAAVRDNKLWITINECASASYPELYLLIHSRGLVIYAKKWDASRDYIAFDKTDFPTGVNHILLITKDLQIISERLVFLLNEDEGLAEFHPQKEAYRKREEVQAEIQLKDAEQHPVKGNFSIAVTSDKEVIADTTLSIVSDILLRSELRGTIDKPEYYFQKGNKEAELAADLLMKTHGWTRYAIPHVIRGELNYPKIPFEKSQEITGIVKSGLFSKPAKNFNVSLISLNRGFFDTAETDENGRFVFDNFEFPDSTKYVIQALNSKGKGKQMTELYVDEDTFPKIQHTVCAESNQLEEESNPIFLDYVAKANLQYTYENGMRIVHLPEVQVKGINRDKDKYKYQSPLYFEPDYSFSEDDIQKYSGTDIRNLLYRVPGVRMMGNSISIRGGGDPLIVIDDMPITPVPGETSIDILNMLNINDIGQIDILKDPINLAIYGSRGGNGVIVIYTKKGEISNSLPSFNLKQMIPLGYQAPIEFYSPKYDTPESINNPKPDLRTTIYWKPDVITDDEGNAHLDFYTADDPATYSVIIEGVADDGKLIHFYGKSVITVK